jgi:hypothetical protein
MYMLVLTFMLASPPVVIPHTFKDRDSCWKAGNEAYLS